MCQAARLTHEAESESSGRAGRPRTVQFSFFGLGSESQAAGELSRPGERTRVLDDRELAAHYARERRRDILTWTGGILAALGLIGLLAWQVLRATR